MRNVAPEMTQAWLSPDKTGDRRPIVRATIQVVQLKSYKYDINDTYASSPLHWTGQYSSVLFGHPALPREIPNIVSISWSRGVDQDVAEATLTLQNTEIVPIGTVPPNIDANVFERPGVYTFSRGITDKAGHFNNESFGWANLLVPDRLVRTYEGYGCDPSVFPAKDPHLMASGVWLIDEVTYNADCTIEVRMRDVGRLMLDMIAHPHVIPPTLYPLSFAKVGSHIEQKRHLTGGNWYRPAGWVETSNKYFVGKNIKTSDGSQYVDKNGYWMGHHSRYPLVTDDKKYWVSTGQTWPDSTGTRVWWQINLNTPRRVAGVRIKVPRIFVVAHVSIWDGNKWVGTRKIPNKKTTEGVNTHSDIPYVTYGTTPANGEWRDLPLGKSYQNVKKVRITFTHLGDWKIDRKHPWRAGLTDIRFYGGPKAKVVVKPTSVPDGNIKDFTDAAKMLAAWGGFYWPPHNPINKWPAYGGGQDYQMTDRETKEFITYVGPADPVLSRGRVWGDFMQTGTAPQEELTPDMFDKQPLWNCLREIADMLGYVCWVDETGGFIWRLPNVWNVGNFLAPNDLAPRSGRSRTTAYITLDDEKHLLNYSTTLSSRNLREQIFVTNPTGRPAALTDGFMPIKPMFRRQAGYTDINFESGEEMEVMADMIATQQKFAYRQASATINGYPAIQIDDQIRIYERVTNETMFHYVKGISCNLDMRAGQWTYDLSTHWLGEDQGGKWVIDAEQQVSTALKRRILQHFGIGEA